MRPAAVGFQCPSCVNEGAKSTRSGRTPYGGTRSTNPALTSQVLIGLNLLVFLFILATGGRASVWFDRLALIPRGRCDVVGRGTFLPGFSESQCLADPERLVWVPGVADGAYWQLITSAFTHVEIWHIGFNMVALWVLGPQLESVLGRTRYLGVYLLSALSGSALVYLLSNPYSATHGASGAVFGLMAALLVVAYKVRGDVRQLLMWIGLNFVITVIGSSFISWQGHLGGFVGGLLLSAAFVYAPKAGRSRWQLVATVALSALIVAIVILRTAALT